MDITFTCPNCRQELEVDADGAGTQIECPECGHELTIPEPTPVNIKVLPVTATAAGAQAKTQLTLPKRAKPAQVTIEKPRASLELEAKGATKKLLVKCLRHGDHVQNGKDNFEQAASEFLQKVGDANLVGMHPIQYSHVDLASGHTVSDYGLLVVYRG
jgi:DNA-directed RNA polymerase subunit RPC12/RpoP